MRVMAPCNKYLFTIKYVTPFEIQVYPQQKLMGIIYLCSCLCLMWCVQCFLVRNVVNLNSVPGSRESGTHYFKKQVSTSVVLILLWDKITL